MAQLSKTDQDSIKKMAASRKVSDEQAPSTPNDKPLPPQPYWFERNGVKVFGFKESDVVAGPEGKAYSMIDTARGELVCQLKPKEVTNWLIRHNGLI